MIKKRNNKFGFTLAEMLLVVSLIGIIGLALYQSLSNGLRIWEHEKKSSVEEDALIFFNKITNDLRNSFKYSLISPEGNENYFAFPTVVWTKQDRMLSHGKEDYVEQIGKVTYSFDNVRKALKRSQANYSEAVNEKDGAERLLVRSIKSFKLLYYFADEQDYRTSSKIENELPAAVKVEIEFLEDTGKGRKMARLIPLPVNS